MSGTASPSTEPTASEPLDAPILPTSKAVRRSLSGAAVLSIQPLLLNALSVPAMAYIIHQLGAVGYAQWMTAVSVLTVLTVVTNLGLRPAFVRTVASDPSLAGAALADQLGLRLTLAGLAGLIAILACALLGYSSMVIGSATLGAVGLLLTSLATTLSDLLQGLQKLKTIATANLVAGLVLTALSVLVAALDLGPVSMAAAYVAGPLNSTLVLGAAARRAVGRVHAAWRPAMFRRLLGQSRFLAAHQLLFAGSAHAEALMLPKLLGMSPFGVFAAGATLGQRLIALPDALCAAAYPVLVKAWRQGPQEWAAAMWRYLAIGLGTGIAVALVCTALAAPLGRLLLPVEAAWFAYVVRITIWSVPLIAAELVLGYSLVAAGRDAAQAKLAAPSAGLCLLLSIVLVTTFGLEGACWSMAVRPAIRALFLASIMRRVLTSTHHAVLNPACQPGALGKAA
ncbi:MAG: oligosaccharide flippase family protein [Phycisphaeraceae bacterium]|nr:oligosaccharide flippase family protein [Phycisphaeraceae bacterium]